MLRHGKKLETVPLEDALSGFIEFLETEKNSCDEETTLVLVAHNGHSFDSPKLINWLKKVGLYQSPILTKVKFGDSMKLAKYLKLMDPYGSKSRSNKGYGLNNVFQIMCPGEKFDAHTALGDSEALFKIMSALTEKYELENVVKGLQMKTVKGIRKV